MPGPRWLPFGKTYTAKGKDGIKRTVYRNINDAVPLALLEGSDKLKAELNVLEKASASLEADHQESIRMLLAGFSSRNESLMMEFRQIYLVYQAVPSKYDDYLKEETSKLLAEQKKLRSMHARIAGLIELLKTSDFVARDYLDAYNRILDELSEANVSYATRLEVDDSMVAAQEWTSTVREGQAEISEEEKDRNG